MKFQLVILEDHQQDFTDFYLCNGWIIDVQDFGFNFLGGRHAIIDGSRLFTRAADDAYHPESYSHLKYPIESVKEFEQFDASLKSYFEGFSEALRTDGCEKKHVSDVNDNWSMGYNVGIELKTNDDLAIMRDALLKSEVTQ